MAGYKLLLFQLRRAIDLGVTTTFAKPYAQIVVNAFTRLNLIRTN